VRQQRRDPLERVQLVAAPLQDLGAGGQDRHTVHAVDAVLVARRVGVRESSLVMGRIRDFEARYRSTASGADSRRRAISDRRFHSRWCVSSICASNGLGGSGAHCSHLSAAVLLASCAIASMLTIGSLMETPSARVAAHYPGRAARELVQTADILRPFSSRTRTHAVRSGPSAAAARIARCRTAAGAKTAADSTAPCRRARRAVTSSASSKTTCPRSDPHSCRGEARRSSEPGAAHRHRRSPQRETVRRCGIDVRLGNLKTGEAYTKAAGRPCSTT
jgi:hypothetical protein